MADYKKPYSHLFINGHEVMHYWVFMLTAHALTNGACVAWVTKNAKWGLFIAITHWFIDLTSSLGLPFIFDQTLHLMALIIVLFLWSDHSNLAKKHPSN